MPYRFPEILDAITVGRLIFIVEGEKDATTLISKGLEATTNRGGAGRWTDELSTMVQGGDFVVLGDNDPAGRDHVELVVKSLLALAQPQSVRTVDLTALDPTLPEKGDVTDYLSRGGTIQRILDAVTSSPNLAVAGNPQSSEYPHIDLASLPEPLSTIVASADQPQDQLTVLLSALTAFGALLPQAFMTVAGRDFAPSLYVAVVGPAASGKGLASVGRDLLEEVQRELATRHRTAMRDYREACKSARSDGAENKHQGEPAKPKPLSIIAPGNSTAICLLELMEANPSMLVIETEADVLATLLRADFGDLSGPLRQAWAHEPVSVARKYMDDPISISRPVLSMCVAATPGQLAGVFRDVHNGLPSRFVFHLIHTRSPFRNPYDPQHWRSGSIGTHFAHETSAFHRWLRDEGPARIEVAFTLRQAKLIEAELAAANVLSADDDDLVMATTRRNAVLIGRIATILTVLRSYWNGRREHSATSTKGMQVRLHVEDEDYATALRIGQYGLTTIAHIGQYLPSQALTGSRMPRNVHAWYSALPELFTRQEALEVAKVHRISERTADRKLASTALFQRREHGRYEKCSRGKLATWQSEGSDVAA